MKSETIVNILPSSTKWSAWVVHDDGFEIKLDSANPVYVNDATLANIDIRLPAALRYLKTNRHADQNSHLDIYRMLQVWEAPFHVVNSRREQVALIRISDITVMHKTVCFGGLSICFNEATLPAANIKCAFPFGIVEQNTFVKQTWLDQNFPFWKDRTKFASDLNIPAAELAYFLFNTRTDTQTAEPPLDLMP